MSASAVRTIRDALSLPKNFLLSGLWRESLKTLPGWKGLLIRSLRALSVSVAEFFKDQCMLRASALTFYTLMSIVPIFAVIFGVAKGFGLEKMLEKELMEQLAGQEQILERLLTFARNLLENTKGGVMAGVGVAVMFWSAIKVMGQIESALNAMWEVRRPRRWARKITDYLAMMIVSPILLLAAGSITVFIRTHIGAAADAYGIIGMMGPLVVQVMKLGPLLLNWALLALIYLAMPNTRVPWRAALAGGVFGGTLVTIVQTVYITFQIGVAKSNAIYGSFAALPLFLVWVQTSWTAVLFGAEFCYAYQHADSYTRAAGPSRLGPGSRKLLGLQIVHRLVHDFAAGRPPLTVSEMANELRTPRHLIQQLVDELKGAGIVSETFSKRSRSPAFLPALDIHQLAVQRVVQALEESGEDDAVTTGPEKMRTLEETLEAMTRAAEASPANRLLKDI
jgi:membrane protein